MRFKVVRIRQDKGFGFAASIMEKENKNKDYFFHCTEVFDFLSLKEGDLINAEIDPNDSKGPRIKNCVKIEKKEDKNGREQIQGRI